MEHAFYKDKKIESLKFISQMGYKNMEGWPVIGGALPGCGLLSLDPVQNANIHESIAN